MNKYKIKVNIELVECDESEQCGLVESKDGKFTKIVNEKEAASIDHCEKALLEMMFPAARKAMESHLTNLSKKSR
jgi:hypothetical protein